MTMPDKEAAAAEGAARRDAAGTGKCRGPMPQQSAFASHGYDFYPQTFVRLVGCHRSSTSEAARLPRKTAA